MVLHIRVKKMIILLFLTVVVAQTQPAFLAGDITCTWNCTTPQCAPWCRPKCDAPVCLVQCPVNQTCSQQPNCQVSCPYSSSPIIVKESCPMCETVCNPLACPNCTVLCEATNCSWDCFAPGACPYPVCNLVCEPPACQAASAHLLRASLLVLFGIALIL